MLLLWGKIEMENLTNYKIPKWRVSAIKSIWQMMNNEDYRIQQMAREWVDKDMERDNLLGLKVELKGGKIIK